MGGADRELSLVAYPDALRGRHHDCRYGYVSGEQPHIGRRVVVRRIHHNRLICLRMHQRGSRGRARPDKDDSVSGVVRAQQSAGELHLRGVSTVNPLWPFLSMFGGAGIIMVGLTMNPPISTNVMVLGVCITFGSLIFGIYNAILIDRREYAEMSTCPVWCARNSPPGECTCMRCRP